MPSLTALRVVVGASLGLGSLDLALINLVLAPALDAPAPEPTVVAPAAPPPLDPPRLVEVVPPDPTPIVEHVYFETNSAVLDATAGTAIARLATAEGEIAISGHADIRGSEAVNRTLSKQRAEAVAAALVARGVDRARILIDYRGADDASNTGPLWRDRRVDIEIGGRR